MARQYTEEEITQLKTHFLVSFLEEHRVVRTCKKVGISTSTFNAWLHKDPEFKQRYEDIVLEDTEELESRLKDIAHGYIKANRESLLALFCILRARKPKVYVEKLQVQHADKDGRPVPVTVIEVRGVDKIDGDGHKEGVDPPIESKAD